MAIGDFNHGLLGLDGLGKRMTIREIRVIRGSGIEGF